MQLEGLSTDDENRAMLPAQQQLAGAAADRRRCRALRGILTQAGVEESDQLRIETSPGRREPAALEEPLAETRRPRRQGVRQRLAVEQGPRADAERVHVDLLVERHIAVDVQLRGRVPSRADKAVRLGLIDRSGEIEIDDAKTHGFVGTRGYAAPEL